MGGWMVRHDRAATVAYYRTLARGGADDCGCSGCRNFALQRSTAFPVEFLRLLEKLGVDTGKEHEVYEMGPASNGLRCYGGWFCFVGSFGRTPDEAAGTFTWERTDLADELKRAFNR